MHAGKEPIFLWYLPKECDLMRKVANSLCRGIGLLRRVPLLWGSNAIEAVARRQEESLNANEDDKWSCPALVDT